MAADNSGAQKTIHPVLALFGRSIGIIREIKGMAHAASAPVTTPPPRSRIRIITFATITHPGGGRKKNERKHRGRWVTGGGVVGEMVTFAAHYIISDWRQRERGVYVCVCVANSATRTHHPHPRGWGTQKSIDPAATPPATRTCILCQRDIILSLFCRSRPLSLSHCVCLATCTHFAD